MNNRFVFVAPMYNASATLPRMLHSICGQSYENWKIILIDDVSSIEHVDASRHTLECFSRFPHVAGKIEATWNSEKKWEVANVLHGISKCEDEDIVCRIDADDWLIDLDALVIIDSFYKKSGCEAMWTAHRWGFSDGNISGPMKEGADPYKHPWVSSHLKTFRKKLLNSVKDENYRGEDGQYIKRAGDQSVYLPALKNTDKRAFLPRVMYHYTIDDSPETYQTKDAVFQKDEAEFLRRRGYID